MSGSEGISKRIIESIDVYISTNYGKVDKFAIRANDQKNIVHDCILKTAPFISNAVKIPMQAIEKELVGNGVSFHDKLFEHIKNSRMDNKDVWKNANLDRKLFSKIRCDEKCCPKKKTVLSLCIALKLDIEQSKDLMSRAGWAFNPSSKFDLIVAWAIEHKEYDILSLNNILYRYTQETLSI